MEFKSKVEEEVYNAMNSGLYKVAGLEMVTGLKNLNLFNSTIKHLDYTNELLNEHLCELIELENHTPGLKEYLNALKKGDVVDNQSLERENSFLIGLYMQLSQETALEKLINYTNHGTLLTKEMINDLAKTLLVGTSSENKEIIRTSNSKFVGRIVNGERVIDYFPIDYKISEEALDRLSEFYHSRLDSEAYDNVFIQPFIIHGLFGALQVFGDGNTRMGRLFQHILMWQLINEKTEFNFEMPTLYTTRSYYPYRGEYRQLIANLVTRNDSEAWNEWFDFNLKRIEDQIYKNQENILSLKRTW